jgi:hypothetical protein
MDWIVMAQDRDSLRGLVIAVMNFRFPYFVGNFLANSKLVSISRRTLLHAVNYRVNYIRNYTDFRKAGIRLVMDVRLSVRTHRISRPPLDGLEKKGNREIKKLQRNFMFC